MSLKKMSIILAIMLAAFFVPAAFAASDIAITRTASSQVNAGETLEVQLNVDVDEQNKPTTYIITEIVPEGFEVVDTDARATDEKQMKWVAIEGLFGGKVEDTTYVYHLRAPMAPGDYEFNGSVMLKDQTKEAIQGASIIKVAAEAEGNDVTVKATSENSYMGYLPYAVALIVIIAAIAFYPKKKIQKKAKDEKK
ncbi:MAG: hypothetical protein ABIG84_00330 [archaeon]